MAFIRRQGKTKIMWLPVAASAGAIAKGSLVIWASGYIVTATTTSVSNYTAGVLAKAIATTDADYATVRLVPVEVPVEKFVTWTADVTASLVVADRGLYQDLTNAYTVNRAAATYDIVQCVEVLSTTKGVFILNIGPDAYPKA